MLAVIRCMTTPSGIARDGVCKVLKEIRAALVKYQLTKIDNLPDYALVEDLVCECLTGFSKRLYQRHLGCAHEPPLLCRSLCGF